MSPGGGRAADLFRALGGWLTRRPLRVPDGCAAIPHSADARITLLAVTGADLVCEVVIDAMVPPAYRLLHAGWVALTLLLSGGICAMSARTPHLLDAHRLTLRTGPFGELSVPLSSVRRVRAVHGLTVGHGLRRSPQDSGAVACSVSSATTLVVELDPPVRVRMRRGEPVLAHRVFFTVTARRRPGSWFGGGQRVSRVARRRLLRSKWCSRKTAASR